MNRKAFTVHWLPLLAVFVLFAFLACVPVAFASPQERDEVSKAIHAKGGRWVAEETSVSKLPPEQRKKRLGLLDHPHGHQEVAVGAVDTSTMTGASATLASFDWRNHNGYNYVTPVRNQGNCGSCWAFATAGALESQILMTKGLSLNLAEQILVSCSGAGSCDGGYVGAASNYLRDTGLPAETYYPYTQTNGLCANALSGWQSNTHQITSWSTVSATVSTVKDALVTHGPLVTTMSVYGDFFYYGGGVYSYTSGTYQGGHAIVLVGYDDAGQYFVAKNSWGAGWGESGYFRIAYSELSSAVKFAGWTYYYYSVNAPPSISIVSPNGTETIQAGTAATVQWNYTGSPGTTVVIELLKSGLADSVIAPSASIGSGGLGSYRWSIPAAQAPDSTYQLRVTSSQNGTYSDTSNGTFAIIPPPPPAITVTTPNGGESIRPGRNQTVRWTYAGNPGSTVRIELLKGGTVVSTLASSVSIGASGVGSFAWRVSSSLPKTSGYVIKVSSADGSVSDVSNGTFTIR